MKRGVRKMSTRTLVLSSCVVGMTVLVLALASCALFNKFPSAGFTIGPSTTGPAPFAVTLSGAPSSDPDGEIKTYSWDYGDGAVGTGRSVTHTYIAVGTYTIILTVTDNWDAEDQAAKMVYVTAAEPAGPTASFTMNPSSGTSPLNVAFDASASTYAAGTITAYEWTFGDGGNGFGRTTTHTYFSSGNQTFTVMLVVRTSDGKTGTTSKTVSVSVPGGGGTTPTGSPSARFDIAPTVGVAPLQVNVDPADSEADAGRTLILYTWSFGDGDATSDVNAATKQHVFTTDTTSKTFSVTLLVLDNEGASDSITKTVKAYNHRPVAGFEMANPPGGHVPPGGVVQFATAGAIDEDNWETDDVVYGNLGALTTVKVWIRSKAIPDDRWFDLNGSLAQSALRTATTSATSTTTLSAPTGYSSHNFSYDPEGQTWASSTRPAWFPNQAWGIRYLYISWGDDSAQQRVDYNAVGVVVDHDYGFTVSGTVRTITVTAEDWLGYESAPFSRMVTLKTGLEGNSDL